jgi:hypothetical protein
VRIALGIYVLIMVLLGAGCAVPNLGTRQFEDVAALLDNPAVQSTLERWAASSDVTNPSMYVKIGGIYEMGMNGVIVRGKAAGSVGKSGMDPDLYERFMEIADRFDQLLPAIGEINDSPPTEGGT